MTRVHNEHDFIGKLASVTATKDKVFRKVIEAIKYILLEIHDILSLILCNRVELSVVFLCALVEL